MPNIMTYCKQGWTYNLLENLGPGKIVDLTHIASQKSQRTVNFFDRRSRATMMTAHWGKLDPPLGESRLQAKDVK